MPPLPTTVEGMAALPSAGAREDARARNLRKKLSQIAALEDRCRSGEDLSAEQRSKVARRAEVEEELRRVLESGVGPPEVLESKRLDAAALEAQQLDLPPPPTATLEPPRLPAARPRAPSSDASGALLCGPPVLRRQHSGHWEDDPIAVEDIAPPHSPHHAPLAEAEILQELQPFAAATRASARMQRLVRATSELSREAFSSDVLEGVSRKGKWKLTLLALPDTAEAEADPWGGLLGFIAYKVKTQVHCISIAKLAVVPEQRGRGHGHKLVHWLIDMAKHRRDIMFVSLSSLPAAVRFYKHIGFRQIDVDLSKLDTSADDDEEFIEGQVYMEYRCRGRVCTKRR